MVGLCNFLVCRVIDTSKGMSSGSIAPTQFLSWIQRVVSISALRGKVFLNRVEVYGSNQNSSADQLGLNPAGLTKWEKHKKSIVSRSLVQISLWKEIFG